MTGSRSSMPRLSARSVLWPGVVTALGVATIIACGGAVTDSTAADAGTGAVKADGGPGDVDAGNVLDMGNALDAVDATALSDVSSVVDADGPGDAVSSADGPELLCWASTYCSECCQEDYAQGLRDWTFYIVECACTNYYDAGAPCYSVCAHDFCATSSVSAAGDPCAVCLDSVMADGGVCSAAVATACASDTACAPYVACANGCSAAADGGEQ